jgi:hypothetical protein
MSKSRDERAEWTLDSEGGSRGSVARSDGEKWVALDKAPKERLSILGIGRKRNDEKGRS